MNASFARQLSGTAADGSFVLSVLAKRTYRLAAAGTLSDPTNTKLVEKPVYSESGSELLVHDSDLYPHKPTTDVIVAGKAYPPRRCNQFIARVKVGPSEKRIAVWGRRHITAAGFGVAAHAEATALTYEEAYGGEDRSYLARHGHPLDALRMELEERPEMFAENPYAFPRNPCGKGFTVEGANDDAELPLFEDPDDPLTPERRRAGPELAWTHMPAPAGLGWFGLFWFPRCVYFGVVPDVDDPARVAEVRAGTLELEILAKGPHVRAADPRLACGASPGLSVPHLRGGETVLLENLSAAGKQLEVTLPAPPAIMRGDGRKGRLIDATPVLNTVLIEPDAERLTVVWRGTIPALRPYLPEELERMPFEVTW